LLDRWQPCRNATAAHAPQAASLFDKFPLLRPLGEALAQVSKSESARLSGRQRRFSKGQTYTRLSNRENLTREGRPAVKTLRAANKRLTIADRLKASFGQLGGYEREGWARRFFEHGRAARKWHRLAPDEQCAAMLARHWDGSAAYGKPEHKGSRGFVEGFNHKIRVIQRRA